MWSLVDVDARGRGLLYRNTRYLSQTIIAIPKIDILHILYLGTLDAWGMVYQADCKSGGPSPEFARSQWSLPWAEMSRSRVEVGLAF